MLDQETAFPSDSAEVLPLPQESIAEALDKEKNPIKRFFKILGPGLITGAADDDPSGIGTYATAGASLGFSILWTALFTLPMMITIQYICARIGMVSGMGLAGVLKKHYSRKLLYPAVAALVIANTINAGTDIGAVAAAINMFLPVPIFVLVLPIAALIVLVQLFGSYRLIANTFKWLTLALFAYIAAAFFARPDFGEVLQATFIPTLRWDVTFLSTLVAILGTTISPYLFFWQASQEVEEEISMGRKKLWQRVGATRSELRYAAWDVNIGMFMGDMVFYFIILTTAATLHKAGVTDIQSATQAADALRPFAGDGARILFAFGLIGSGLLAIPILTGSAVYALSEAFGWNSGLDSKPPQAREFYLAIGAATLVGTLINFLGINPIKALFWTAVINGFLAPPLLVLIMLIANNEKIMGERVNSLRTNIMGWTTTFIMFVVAVALVIIAL
jgi:NRAMP (natural resistance-associated macrophage protein)-like metal ion transporter